MHIVHSRSRAESTSPCEARFPANFWVLWPRVQDMLRLADLALAVVVSFFDLTSSSFLHPVHSFPERISPKRQRNLRTCGTCSCWMTACTTEEFQAFAFCLRLPLRRIGFATELCLCADVTMRAWNDKPMELQPTSTGRGHFDDLLKSGGKRKCSTPTHKRWDAKVVVLLENAAHVNSAPPTGSWWNDSLQWRTPRIHWFFRFQDFLST